MNDGDVKPEDEVMDVPEEGMKEKKGLLRVEQDLSGLRVEPDFVEEDIQPLIKSKGKPSYGGSNPCLRKA